jgi:hypothetical protein
LELQTLNDYLGGELMKVEPCNRIDKRLATYLSAAGAIGATMASEAEAVIVSNQTTQPFGVNGVVSIDFNSDGQIDFQIDHDRVDLTPQSGPIVDYLQIDKNDVNGEANPLAFDPRPDLEFKASTFPVNGTPENDSTNAGYVISGMQGSYPAALNSGALIGPASTFDYQESANFQGTGKDIRANRLVDEDMTQIDQILGGQPASGVQLPFGDPGFDDIGGQIRYLGLRMGLNTNHSGSGYSYGWVGVRITNEDDATGEVVGWAYNSSGGSIRAGQVPEPTSIVTVLLGGMFAACVVWRRWFRR